MEGSGAVADGVTRGRPLLDAINLRLLEALLDNPRLTNAELARRVEVSAPTVADRLQRLETAGVMAGCHLGLNPAALGLPLAAYVRIRPGPGQLGPIIQLAERTHEVVECHRVTGEESLLLKVQVAGLDHLTDVVDQFFALGQITTSIVQGSPVPPRRLRLPHAPAR